MVRRRRLSSGYTLLELLVVLVVVGLTLSMAVLSVGDGGRGERIKQESKRIAALLELAGEEALLDGRELGLRLYRDGYTFVYLEGKEWKAFEEDFSLRPRALPKGLALLLYLDGLELKLELKDYVENPPAPQLLLLSSGEHTPFELMLIDGPEMAPEEQLRYRLSAGPIGPVTVEGPLEGEL